MLVDLHLRKRGGLPRLGRIRFWVFGIRIEVARDLGLANAWSSRLCDYVLSRVLK